MSSNLQQIPSSGGKPAAKSAAAKRNAQGAEEFLTREAIFAQQHQSFDPYWRFNDPLCEEFLRFGAGEDVLEGIKLLFPFVRLLSLYRVPRTVGFLAPTIRHAFLAGHDLGRAHPGLVDDALPSATLCEGSTSFASSLVKTN